MPRECPRPATPTADLHCLAAIALTAISTESRRPTLEFALPRRDGARNTRAGTLSGRVPDAGRSPCPAPWCGYLSRPPRWIAAAVNSRVVAAFS